MTRNDYLGSLPISPAAQPATFPEVRLFLQPHLPVDPLPTLQAMAKGCTHYGADWVKTSDFQAMLHLLTMMSHGQDYQLNGYDEYFRLEGIFQK